MVLLRAAAWAWLGVLPVVWCLPLEGMRSAQQQHQKQEQHPQPFSLLEDLSASNLQPQDFTQEDYQQLLARQPDPAAGAIPSLNSYDASEGAAPYVYRLQEGVAGAGLPATGLAGDVTALENPDWMNVDPRYYLLSQYLEHPEEATVSDSGSTSNSMTPVRKIRNSLDESSRSSSTSSDFDNSSSKAKRNWPRGYSRRRTSGLSLSIDASMKVLREALYLEMARKKQRQQMIRARHNQTLLTSIGKRDVSRQLQQDRAAAAVAAAGQDHHLSPQRM